MESRAGGAEYPFMERERVKEVKGKEEGGEELLFPPSPPSQHGGKEFL